MPTASTPSKFLLLSLIGGGVIILDQISKFYVQDAFRLHESVPVIDDFFSLTYIRNPGAAFGFLADQDGVFRAIFFLTVSVIALSLLVYFFLQTPKEDISALIAISLLFGGA
ncbi:MAG: signal peptidase II, partial [Nitrospiria bacterium]